MEPIKSFTNVKAADFIEKLHEVKKDNKDNLVAVDKESGNVTIFTFDEKIPSDFKTGLAKAHIVFEDLGEDDNSASEPEINKFMAQVNKAGTIFEPTDSINSVLSKIPAFKNDMNEKINIMNISNNIHHQLDKFSEALESKNVPEIEKWSGILNQTVKQIAMDKFYVPDFGGIMSIGRNEYKLAENLREITFLSEVIVKNIKENDVTTGLK